MVAVLDYRRNSTDERISSGHGLIKVPSGILKVSQQSVAHTVQGETFREDSVTEYRALGTLISEEVLPDVNPLPWRQCAVLMVLASVAVYGLGFLVVTGFNHLFQYLQL